MTINDNRTYIMRKYFRKLVNGFEELVAYRSLPRRREI